MGINEANLKLIKIGNAVIDVWRCKYYVTPRTVKEILPIQNYECFKTVDDAYGYAIGLPSNWNME